jgi:hypothetical protein
MTTEPLTVTARQLNRATLARQLLLEREKLDVAEGLRRMVALQAQHPASPYIALWSRLVDCDPRSLDAAYADGTVVRASLMRVTLHAVHRADFPEFRAAMEPLLQAFALGPRFSASGMTAGDAAALLPEVYQFTRQPRTSADVEAWLTNRLGTPVDEGVIRAIRTWAPLVHAPVDAPWSFGRHATYVAAPLVQNLAQPGTHAEGMKSLIRRYLEGFGPASITDIAQFTKAKRGILKEAIGALDTEIVRFSGPAGVELFDIPQGALPAETSPAPPRLLPMWDSVLLSYADRSRIIPPEYRKAVIRVNGDVLPTLLVDGYVAGVWRSVDEGIEVTAFRHLAEDVWEHVAQEANALVLFLSQRDPNPYGRYRSWWKDMPAAEVRVFAGQD